MMSASAATTQAMDRDDRPDAFDVLRALHGLWRSRFSLLCMVVFGWAGHAWWSDVMEGARRSALVQASSAGANTVSLWGVR